MKSIMLLDVYFGKLPSWINLFIETCKYNPTVNWTIFTDDKFPKNKCKNVKFIKSSVNKINKLMSEKLNLNIKVENPYKFCDLRPAFGVIFKDYFKGYDYWGHTDLDVLFGNIRTFITGSLTSKFDIISSDPRKICGPFTIFKNIEKVNLLYKKLKPSYKEIFENIDKHYHSNEQAMTEVVNLAHNKREISKSYRDLHKHEISTYSWEEGKIKIKSNGEHTMYVHLRKFKDTLDPKPTNCFEVNPKGFKGESDWVKEWEDNNGK